EGNTLSRIQCGDLVNLAAWDSTHRRDVVEVNGARIVWCDERLLETGLREHQHLRVGLNAELFEQARKISGAGTILERGCAVLQCAAEPGDWIAQGLTLCVNSQKNDHHPGHRKTWKGEDATAVQKSFH